ncbi:MAG: hypothetical protein QXI90_07415 [Thermofilum sp.]
MGHIYVKATFYNAVDYVQYVEGKRRLEEVRKVEVEALVDTGATFPALPEDVVAELALPSLGERSAEAAEGAGEVRFAAKAIIEAGWGSAAPVIVRPRGATLLIGAVALEQMG